MFDLNPLNLPGAQLQHWIMLLVAGTLGFLIGYASRRSAVNRLKGELSATERAIDDCRRPVPFVGSNTEETIVLNRIAARAGELNFDRIGRASADEADDLKEIAGLGPFLERKLHAVGIYTFRQIANFTPDDVETVNNVIEFFPGRIERDNWVGQAAGLLKRKQS